MLPDLSPAHIIIVIVVALIVVGPKDLPKLLRKIGQFMGRMRSMANEFRASFDEMARQSELEELRKEVAAMRAASEAALPKSLGVEEALQSDSESAYLAQWQASHAEPTDTPAPEYPAPGSEPSILPPPAPEAAPAPAKTPKPRAASKPKAEGAPARPEAAPKKPRAQKSGAQKSGTQKSEGGA